MKASNHEENVSERLREQLSKSMEKAFRLSHTLIDREADLERYRTILEHVRDIVGDGDDESDDFSGLPELVKSEMSEARIAGYEDGDKAARPTLA